MYTIYSKPACTFCDQAKALLDEKQIPYNEIVLDVGQVLVEGKAYLSRNELLALIPGARTMPQILCDARVVGGFQELKRELQTVR